MESQQEHSYDVGQKSSMKHPFEDVKGKELGDGWVGGWVRVGFLETLKIDAAHLNIYKGKRKNLKCKDNSVCALTKGRWRMA